MAAVDNTMMCLIDASRTASTTLRNATGVQLIYTTKVQKTSYGKRSSQRGDPANIAFELILRSRCCREQAAVAIKLLRR